MVFTSNDLLAVPFYCLFIIFITTYRLSQLKFVFQLHFRNFSVRFDYLNFLFNCSIFLMPIPVSITSLFGFFGRAITSFVSLSFIFPLLFWAFSCFFLYLSSSSFFKRCIARSSVMHSPSTFWQVT